MSSRLTQVDVASVGLTAPSELSVAGSPITQSGNLGLTWANESANRVLAGPTTGSATTPGFRALVAADVPNLDAAKITTGTLALARGGTAADNSSVTANQIWAGPTSGIAASAGYRALVAGDVPNLDAGKITTGTLALARGGTALDTSAVTDGQILIGQTTGHTFGLATISAGTGISVTNSGHGISIGATGAAAPVVQVPIFIGTASDTSVGNLASGGLGGGICSTFASLGSLFIAKSGGTVFTDLTGNFAGSSVTISFAALNDALYWGSPAATANNRFYQIQWNQTNSATTNYTLAFEYWNGSAWTAINGVQSHALLTNLVTGISGQANLYFPPPGDWALKTVNAVSAWWIRMRVSAYTSNPTPPIIQQIGAGASQLPMGLVSNLTGLYAPVTGTISSINKATGIQNSTTYYNVYNLTQNLNTYATFSANAVLATGLTTAFTRGDQFCLFGTPTNTNVQINFTPS